MLPEELLMQISSGNAAAFRQFYELFKDKVYNTCLSYLQDIPEAEEVLQDVFVEIYQSASKFRRQSSVSTWVYRITVNKCIDKVRYRNRQKRAAIIFGLFSKTTGEASSDFISFEHPGVLAENRETAKILFAAIRQLPEQQQAAFILKYIEGLTQKEIAEILNVSGKAIESLLQRAKTNLRKLLADFNG